MSMPLLSIAHAASAGVLTPAGPIAEQERNIIILSVLIMLCIVVPFLVTFFIIARKYRAGNPKAKYEPDKKHGPWSEIILWVLPAIIVVVLGILTWKATHALDPYKPIDSNVPPLTIQVIALPWKWLFIYPQQGIAAINFIEFPAGTPLHFVLTADAPMSSFWIPQLGSQIYAMSGMETQLNLMADKTGQFMGEDTEINGEGYSGMKFIADSVPQETFDGWVQSTKAGSNILNMDVYNQLAQPSENNSPAFYSSVDESLYNTIVMKFMGPTSSMEAMPGMDMPGMQM